MIAEVQAASKGRSENPEAYRLYLQGQFFRDQLNQDATARAVECYQQALKLDPEYALALAGLSRAMSDLAGQNWIPRTDGYEIARTAAQKAVTLEPTLPEAHTALGWVLGWYDWNWKAADASFQRALELAPGSTLAINGAATFFGNLGNLDVAVGLFRRAVGLDPLNVPVNRNLGLYCLAAGALQEAEAALTKTLQLSTQSGMTYCWRGLTRLAPGPARRSPCGYAERGQPDLQAGRHGHRPPRARRSGGFRRGAGGTHHRIRSGQPVSGGRGLRRTGRCRQGLRMAREDVHRP